MSVRRLPPGVTGDPRLVRIGVGLLREDRDACPDGRALRARPLLVRRPDRFRHRPIEDFFFAPVAELLDAVEHNGARLDSALAGPRHADRCHPMHRAWAAEAAAVYLAARRRHEAERVAAGHAATVPKAEEWVVIDQLRHPDARGVMQYERTVWGRRYATDDGSVREIWIPFISTVKDRADSEISAAAAIAARGVPAARAEFRGPYNAIEKDVVLPRRVRVIGVGLGDGGVSVLADWTADEALDRFRRQARRRYAEITDGTGANPGSDCVGCVGLADCTAVREIPGLLGVPAPRRPRKRRSVSVSDLRTYQKCPARFHMTRTLNITDRGEESAAIRRGRAVDACLNDRHNGADRVPCRRLPLPDAIPGLPAAEQEAAIRMLGWHRPLCPLDGLGSAELVQPQRRLAAYDPIADVVVIADPDLLYTDRGGWVWRETKTAGKRTWEGESLLSSHPQIALAVLLMASGVPGGDPGRSRIELELLREDGSALEEFDPSDPALIAEARRVVSALAAGWAADETYDPVPGRHCADCEARRWCPSGPDTTAGGEATR
ncbi:PD-(D/E)XK nuclease family protein [Thermopolyspora sp. NPDC052614]|uniref:PD-(D/E)XK nuclease family protein n=1 Tax=Thermopolyspora sp. NPDC052614 TaxID=3155682 RepID=UPI003437BD5C